MTLKNCTMWGHIHENKNKNGFHNIAPYLPKYSGKKRSTSLFDPRPFSKNGVGKFWLIVWFFLSGTQLNSWKKQKKKFPKCVFLAWLLGNILSKFQRKTLKNRRKRTPKVCFTRWNFLFRDMKFIRCNEKITKKPEKIMTGWSIKWRLILL